MAKSKSLPLAAVLIASAFFAAAFTFSDTLLPSPVSKAVADAPSQTTESPCQGQAWPHYSPECLASMARDTDQQSPQRVLTVLRTTH